MCDKCEDEGYTHDVCFYCNGSGEGPADGTKCIICNDTGVEKNICNCSAGKELEYGN